jgi:hypothetical protein
MLRSALLLSALIAAACTRPASPAAPSATAAAAEPNQPAVKLVLDPRAPALRLRAVGLREATDIDVLLDWQGEVYYDGFSRGSWWFVDEYHWEWVFTLDRNHRTMSFHVWRGQPIEGDGLLGVIWFRNPDHLPLRGASAWVDGVAVLAVVTTRDDRERNADLGPPSHAAKESR